MVQAYVFLIIGRSCVFGRFCFKLCSGLRFGQQVNGFEAQACKTWPFGEFCRLKGFWLRLVLQVQGFGCLL